MNGSWVSSKVKLPKENTSVLVYRRNDYQILKYTSRWKNDYCVIQNRRNDPMADWRGWYDDHDWKVCDKEIIWFDGELPAFAKDGE